MSPERVSVGRGRRKSFHVDGPKTEKAREPKLEILVREIRRLRVSEAERNVDIIVTTNVSPELCSFARFV